MKNKCFHLVGRHCSFYSANCGPRNKMACGHGIYGYIPDIAAVFVGCLLAGLVLYFSLCQIDANVATWAEKTVVIKGSPADWRKQSADCDRRAKLIGGYVEYLVDGPVYCRVHKGGE